MAKQSLGVAVAARNALPGGGLREVFLLEAKEWEEGLYHLHSYSYPLHPSSSLSEGHEQWERVGAAALPGTLAELLPKQAWEVLSVEAWSMLSVEVAELLSPLVIPSELLVTLGEGGGWGSSSSRG